MNKNFTEIDYCNKSNSFKLLWAMVLLIQLTLAFYIIKDNQFFAPIYQLTFFTFILSSCFFVAKPMRTPTLSDVTVYVMMILAVVNWLLIAHTITVVWGTTTSTDKVLLIGFFSMLICFNSSKFLIIVSTLPVIVTHTYYQVTSGDMTHMELFFSFIKFPFFILAIIITQVNYNVRLVESHKKLVLLNKELTVLRNTDALTNLYNRRAFDEKLKYLLELHNRIKQPVSLMILDVDFFKNYNDSLGHPQGDACLKIIASTMSESIRRETDVVARVGGEEFGIILPNTSLADCQLLAEKIVNAVKGAEILHPDSRVSNYVTISIGCACINGSITTPEAIYHRADRALYHAKKQGRNRFAI